MPTLMGGSEAIAHAAIDAGCRFYAAYPMTPATKLLDAFLVELPKAGGVCIQAESELEAVGMAWGALATGARAAVGGCGQGLSLMQESFAEMTLAELPLVVFDMARGQSDYFQATRGGGHGDYRHIVLAPKDLPEAVQLTGLAFELAERWRNPVVVMGDYVLAHAVDTVDLQGQRKDAAPMSWGLDGSTSGSGRARMISPYGEVKGDASNEALDPEALHRRVYAKHAEIERCEGRCEVRDAEDAEHLVASWGTAAKFVGAAVRSLRREGLRIGTVRPVTLWPFPRPEVHAAAAGRSSVLVFETNAGQMFEDVERAVAGAAPVRFIGDFSTDRSSFGVGPLLDVDEIAQRIRDAVGASR